ncbi:winged helix-turn-helix domain-containing protein [Bacillus thuringiensis]|uniref:winged helix-turn-helix domain-containing protein n=1 Tax=Bacillus thuringiensis TaxID=1428 RepID=UPI0028530A68|nr:winged helix-turn-helix domain-containing protein [Bacillus thuringiensis]MDR4920286.1 winged helix-turn-helix domain-containing protein [Bacillus thuringiensis]
MLKVTFIELIYKVLLETKESMTPLEIWKYIESKGYHLLLKSQSGTTPWKTISARIYTDIKGNSESPLMKVNSRPVKFKIKT